VNFCARQAKVPISREGLGWWEGDVAEVDRRNGETNISADYYHSEPHWDRVLDRERHDGDSH